MHKLRVKIGQDEFEAEGEPEWLNTQLGTWKELISKPPMIAGESQVKHRLGEEREGESRKETPTPQIAKVLSVDKNQKSVSLRVHPTGDQREADAILLLLFGYRDLLNSDEVLVPRIKESMAQSGIRVDRVDRAIAPHQKAGFVLKGGTGKGGKYRLTNTGDARARELIATLSS
jgi:hypothetical protein